jgi:hypothetical protein
MVGTPNIQVARETVACTCGILEIDFVTVSGVVSARCDGVRARLWLCAAGSLLPTELRAGADEASAPTRLVNGQPVIYGS